MAKPRKVPKTIAGVKVPKALRRGLRDLAGRRKGRALLAETLKAAGAALSAIESGARAADATRIATTVALEEAARAFTQSLRRREPDVPTPETTPSPSSATH